MAKFRLIAAYIFLIGANLALVALIYWKVSQTSLTVESSLAADEVVIETVEEVIEIEEIELDALDLGGRKVSAQRILNATGEDRKKLLDTLLHQLSAGEKFFDTVPIQLRRGCCGRVYFDEETLLKQLLDDGDLDLKVFAGNALWQKHSRLYAEDVIKFVNSERHLNRDFLKLQFKVYTATRPSKIFAELEHGDDTWGAWLAYLQPNPEFVPMLIQKLDTHPKQRAATIAAMSKTKDPRCIPPLKKLLLANTSASNDAAWGLGELELAEAEQILIESLNHVEGYVKRSVCAALCKIGTPAAIPKLATLLLPEPIEDDVDPKNVYVHTIAKHAIQTIRSKYYYPDMIATQSD